MKTFADNIKNRREDIYRDSDRYDRIEHEKVRKKSNDSEAEKYTSICKKIGTIMELISANNETLCLLDDTSEILYEKECGHERNDHGNNPSIEISWSHPGDDLLEGKIHESNSSSSDDKSFE
jgi:hypothetical protein